MSRLILFATTTLALAGCTGGYTCPDPGETPLLTSGEKVSNDLGWPEEVHAALDSEGVVNMSLDREAGTAVLSFERDGEQVEVTLELDEPVVVDY